MRHHFHGIIVCVMYMMILILWGVGQIFCFDFGFNSTFKCYQKVPLQNLHLDLSLNVILVSFPLYLIWLLQNLHEIMDLHYQTAY